MGLGAVKEFFGRRGVPGRYRGAPLTPRDARWEYWEVLAPTKGGTRASHWPQEKPSGSIRLSSNPTNKPGTCRGVLVAPRET